MNLHSRERNLSHLAGERPLRKLEIRSLIIGLRAEKTSGVL